MRRLACLSLLFAWFCASGSLLDLVQGFAWARMFADYARVESVTAAASDTFDPARPCDLCKAVNKARQAVPPATAPTAAEKLVLICQEAGGPIVGRTAVVWMAASAQVGERRIEDVPIPPPRVRVG